MSPTLLSHNNGSGSLAAVLLYSIFGSGSCKRACPWFSCIGSKPVEFVIIFPWAGDLIFLLLKPKMFLGMALYILVFPMSKDLPSSPFPGYTNVCVTFGLLICWLALESNESLRRLQKEKNKMRRSDHQHLAMFSMYSIETALRAPDSQLQRSRLCLEYSGL